MPVANVYSMPQVIAVTTGAVGAPNMNYPLNQNDLRVFKYVQNTVSVFVRDVDRKPVNMGASSMTVVITNQRSKVTLLQKSLTVVDSTRGLYQFTIEANELQKWSSGGYVYTLVATDANGHATPLYTNQSYSCQGAISVEDGPFPPLAESVTFAWNELASLNGGAYFLSGSFPGSSNLGDPSGINTLFAYPDSFAGTIRFDASLSVEVPISDSEWFAVDTIAIAAASSQTTQKVFNGNFRWVRIAVIPLPGNTGTISRFMLRN